MDLGLSPLPVNSDSEILQLYGNWNNTKVDFPTHKCIAEVFQQQVLSSPEAIAAVFRDQKVTYKDLNESANKLAWFLIERGIGSDALVCIFAERSINFLTSILGIFKAGGAYLPLDPLAPSARLRSMLEQSESRFIITTEAEFSTLAKSLSEMDENIRPQIFMIEECLKQELPGEDPPIKSTPNDLAYVIFTSGSTGLPKGAMVEQKGMMNHLFAKIKDLNLTASDRIVQNASQCFDISVWQFLAGLLAGAQTHIVDEDVAHDTEALLAYAESNQISILEIVPSMLRAILDLIKPSGNDRPQFSALRWMILTGEALPPRYCGEWLSLYPHIPMFNAYGPTECSDDVTHYPIYKAPAEDVVHMPIGYPVANMQLYVVEHQGEEFKLCSVGASGELCVTGIGVGRGYINDAQRTKAAFFKDPFSQNSDARLYRTGDLARYLPDGTIEFLGRIDSQVKIRGFRIELGEIESVLLRHEGVKECAVIVRSARQMQGKLVARECIANVETNAEADRSERKRLLAYLVCREEVSNLELRSFLQQYVPSYMIPEQFIRLDALPLNANGKVDKKNLPEPENVRPDLDELFVAPSNELETLIASMWQDLLSVDRIGVNDSFFELGGDSLLAIQVLNRIRQATNANVTFRNFFEAATVAGLARIIDRAEKGTSSVLSTISARAQSERYRLSFAQQRMWFLWQLEPDNPYYTFQGILNVKGKLDLHVFRRAWHAIWKRHEILRARFGVEDGRPFQVFDDGEDFEPLFINLTHLPEAGRHQAVRNRARAEAERAFDLEEGKLFRIQLFKISDDEHVALLTMHEIILDGWATCVIIRELGELYNGFIKGVESPLQDLAVKFSDFVSWEGETLERDVLKEQEDYWKVKLSGELPILDLAPDRPVSPTFLGKSHGVLLDADLSGRIHKLSRQEGTTLFVVILAAFYKTLHRYTGQDDLIIGAPLANRSHKDTEDIVGFFLNMLAFRTDLSGDLSFSDLIHRVRETVTEGITRSDYPFIWLLENVNTVRNPSIAPVFQVMLNMLSFPQVTLQYDDLEMGFRELETGYTKYDLSLYAQEQGDQVYLQLSYLTDLFDDEATDRILKNMVAFLNSAVSNPAVRMSRLDGLTEVEKKNILVDLNNTTQDFDYSKCIHEIFQLQAEKTPEQTALIFNGQRLNYGDLNARANQLANYLRRRGIVTETGVAVCLERSFDTIAALLGVLKAGGYYIALDPDYPPLRLNKMLSDTEAPILLLHRSTDKFEDYVGEKIYLDYWTQLEKEDISNPPCLSNPDNILNVVYTSSTTGNPKGAFITMKSVLNRIFWMWEAYPFQPDDVAVLQKSTALVAATWECFGALLKGVPTLILSREDLLDPQELWSRLVTERVSYLLASPALLQGVIDQAQSHWSEWTTLRLATTSAETISVTMAAQWNSLFPQAPLLNLYGSTECSSNVTVYNTSEMPSDAARVLVGKPLSNTRVYILNDLLELVPTGGKGEMCVSGECLARGYLNLPDLTAERFIPDPFSDLPGSRLYRTGDLARYCADGNIELLGRKDNQIKVRGFRVELDDVEVAILWHPMVKKCAVRVYGDQDGRNRLAAYLIADESLSSSALRSFLRERLPEYMIPSDFMMVDALPLTPAGKIDRRALPLPDQTRRDLDSTFVAPRTDTESLIANIWSQILGVKQVGIYDNFFDLGGHSLMATQILSRLQNVANVRVPLRAMYETPTIANLAEVVEAATGNLFLQADRSTNIAGAVEWEEGEL